MQVDIAREDGLSDDYYLEFYKLASKNDQKKIGEYTLNLLKRYHEIGDISVNEFQEITGQSLHDYRQTEGQDYLEFMDAENSEDISLNYDQCLIHYDLKNNVYKFTLFIEYKKGAKILSENSESTGKPNVLTFETPLIFKDSITSEALGTMILEAFDRSHKMSLKLSGKYIPPKTIEIYNNISVEFTPPNDKHFTDLDDGGIGEIYQLYSYVPKEGAKATDALALTSAPELFKELTVQNIREEWIRTYGEPDEICVTEKQYGIFKFRAEIKNKDYYCISYITTIDCGEFTQNLECGMQIISPARKKKLCASLAESIEQFALSCKIKYQS